MSDLIKRNDAVKAVCEGCLSIWKTCQYHWDCPALTNLMKLPSADRPQGEWIIEIDVNGNTYGRCSICGMRQYAGQLNFCPDCGARMKGVEDE